MNISKYTVSIIVYAENLYVKFSRYLLIIR